MRKIVPQITGTTAISKIINGYTRNNENLEVIGAELPMWVPKKHTVTFLHWPNKPQINIKSVFTA